MCSGMSPRPWPRPQGRGFRDQVATEPGRVEELQTAILADRAIAAFEAERYGEAIPFLDQLGQISSRRQDLTVLRGYAYMNLKRYDKARRIFEALAATGNRDAMQGLAAIGDTQEIWPNKN